MPALAPDYCESIARSLEFLRSEYAAPAKSNSDSRWLLSSLSAEDGLETATLQQADADFITVRGRMRFPGIKPAQVQRLVHDCVNRTAWDDMLEEGKFAREYGAVRTACLPECQADVIRLVYKGLMGVSSRDLCLLRAWGQDDDGKCWLVAESCVDDVVPEDANCVRAELRECGYMFEPSDDGCIVTYISQTNFNGWIPSFMQNVMMMQQPESLRKMYQVLVERAVRPGGA
eukprot:TRINITY_DN13955_c0_g1_i1.p1 TRINITY_DN13955_c0_g1~~TRINITY_DN13955_c0_g1_i1.p1  ORF type:complete len:231 (-),score=31.04 TRINITY_DN13955_c0_g1_i1:208-900(-)